MVITECVVDYVEINAIAVEVKSILRIVVSCRVPKRNIIRIGYLEPIGLVIARVTCLDSRISCRIDIDRISINPCDIYTC